MNTQIKQRQIDYSELPEHIRLSVKRYIENHEPTGSFLTAVICNKLKESFMYADETNIRRMFDIVKFFYNHAPMNCWGSEEKMSAWLGQESSTEEEETQC